MSVTRICDACTLDVDLEDFSTEDDLICKDCKAGQEEFAKDIEMDQKKNGDFDS